jgi:hypothetical protein
MIAEMSNALEVEPKLTQKLESCNAPLSYILTFIFSDSE